jgi:ACS family glucarate transporter-like MFS transporter
MQTLKQAAPAQRPTTVRYLVIVFAVLLAAVTYIDRICISQAMPAIVRDLNFNPVQTGYIFAAFGWAYALFEIPGGFLGDWLGPRKVLMRIVVWWSFFTAATGWAWNFTSLVVTRALFGAGEAGCFPNITKSFTTWLPQDERVRAQGIVWLAARWGGAFTPYLVILTFQFMSWRRAFELFGVLGVVWAIFFYRWYRDNPADNPKVNQAELDLLRGANKLAGSHGDVPWRKLLTSRSVWCLCAQYFCLSYGWYFYITWLPTYLKEARHLAVAQGAVLAGLPLFLGGLGSLFCGVVSAPLTRWTGSVAVTRKLMACAGFTGASALLILSINLQNPVAAMIAMGFASFCNDLAMPGSWGACMDVGGRYAGTLSGAMNMMGNAGGAMCPMAIGYILSRTGGNWDVTFYVSAAIYFMGSFFWLVMDPVTPLDKSDEMVAETA